MRAGRIRPLLLVGLLTVAAARGAEPSVLFPNESRPTASRLADARKLLDDKKWPEALDELQAILDGAGGDLVAVSPRYSVPARRQCHLLIAQLPPDALKTYRARMEPQAAKWLEQGRTNRDPRLLRKVADEAFCTRAGEGALDALGDLAFERGDFGEAEAWWRQIAPPPDAGPVDPKTDLVYPDPQGGAARVAAKQVLARIFRQPHGDWSALLKTFRDKYADAEGTLAGRKGKYADLLAEIARQAKTDTGAEVVWSTYGGDAARGLVLPVAPRFLDDLERQCRRGPTYSIDLGPAAREQGKPATPSVLSRAMAFHPLIAGEHALIADACYVKAIDLHTGTAAVWFDLKEHAAVAEPDLQLPLTEDSKLLDLRYTLTLADDCVYARLGAQQIYRTDDSDKNRERATASAVACLSVKPGPKGSHVRWVVRPAPAAKGAIFEGTPVVHQGQLYVAVTYFENDRTVTAVVCYPTGTEREPAPRWTQVVCETQELRGREKRTRHQLLTVAGPNVVYCSHSGAVVAVDAQTGKPAWAVRYPIHEGRDLPVLRDLAPPVYADGRLFVAPADCDHLLCLDAQTGQTLWDRDRLEPTHLLGVGHGLLIFTTINGLRAITAADGSNQGGWQLPDGGGERAPAGRGMLVGDQVLWPTASGIVVCDQRDGTLDYRPTLGARVPPGNLAYGNGCLAVADRTTLALFVPESMALPERKRQQQQQPDAPAAWLNLGIAQADAGLFDKAHESLQKAQTLLRPGSDRGLREELRRESLYLLLTQARRAAAVGDWRTADSRVKELTEARPADQALLDALLRAAEMWEDAEQPARATAVWQTIKTFDEPARLQVFGFARWELTARNLAVARISRLTRTAVSPSRLAPRTVADEPLDLPLPLSRQWQIELEADERLLPIGDGDDLLVTARPGLVTTRVADTGKPRWHRRLAFTPRWVAPHLDTLVTAGRQGAACLRREDGAVVWEIPAPVLFAGHGPAPLDSFQLVNGRFYFLAGRQWLFALDAETGALLWNQAAPGAGLDLPAPLGRWNPAFLAGATTVLAQPTSGRTTLLDARTGQTLQTLTVNAGLWWQSPVAREANAFCFAPNARSILQIGGTPPRTQWEYALTEATTLAGEPPRMIARKNVLLALIATNIGDQLQRLNPTDGKPQWPQAPLLAGRSRPVEPSGWALDDDAVYYEQGGRLYARALLDGKLLWDKPLNSPAASYHTRRLRYCLLTYPTAAGSGRFQFRFLWGSVQWERPVSRDDATGPGLVVVCSDPKTGQVIERLNLAPSAPRPTWRWATRFTLLPCLEGAPLPPKAEQPVVQMCGRGLVVAAGARMWRFKRKDER